MKSGRSIYIGSNEKLKNNKSLTNLLKKYIFNIEKFGTRLKFLFLDCAELQTFKTINNELSFHTKLSYENFDIFEFDPKNYRKMETVVQRMKIEKSPRILFDDIKNILSNKSDKIMNYNFIYLDFTGYLRTYVNSIEYAVSSNKPNVGKIFIIGITFTKRGSMQDPRVRKCLPKEYSLAKGVSKLSVIKDIIINTAAKSQRKVLHIITREYRITKKNQKMVFCEAVIQV